MILASAAVLALGMGIVFAGEGECGYTAGPLQWRAANGSPIIPASGLL
jgi:hypothetical protein